MSGPPTSTMGDPSPPLGICFGTRSGLSPLELAALGSDAEAADFSVVFVAERRADAFPAVQAVASATSGIAVGTAVANLFTRHPVPLGLTAAAIDEVSGGRLVLGLGTSNRELNQTQLGLAAHPPLESTEEYVAVLRKLFRGGPVEHAGPRLRVTRFVPDRPPLRAEIPIYLAGLGPKMIGLAGAIADGVILNLVDARGASAGAELAREAARAAHRAEAPVVACVLPCCIDDDEELALAMARRVVAGYADHPGAASLFSRSGFGEEVAAIAQQVRTGAMDGAAALVPEEMARAFVVVGGEDDCRVAVAAHRDAGVDLPILYPMPVSGGWQEAASRCIGAFHSTPTDARSHRAQAREHVDG